MKHIRWHLGNARVLWRCWREARRRKRDGAQL